MSEFSEAMKFLKKSDPVLAKLFGKVQPSVLRPSKNYFESLAIFKEINENTSASIVLANIANYYNANENFSKALYYFKSSLNFAHIAKDNKRIAVLLGNLGVLFYNSGNYLQALKFYQLSLDVRDKIEDKKGAAYILNNIGAIYDEQKNYQKAYEYYQKALVIRKEINDEKGLIGIYNNIGVSLSKTGSETEALDYFFKAGKMAEKINFISGLTSAQNNIGDSYSKLNQPEKALEFYNKAEALYLKTDDQSGLAVLFLNYGHIYRNNKQNQKAVDYYLKAFQLSKEAQDPEVMKNACQYLSEIYSAQNDLVNAWKFKRQYSQISDSILSIESIRQVANLQAGYEAEKKENEILLLKKENEIRTKEIKQNRWLSYTFVGLFFILLLFVLIGIYIFRQKSIYRQLVMQRENDRKMLNKIIETEENERKRFARDLHDGLGPLLSGIKLYINGLSVEDNSSDAEHVKFASELIDEAISNIRLLSNNLMPSVLEDFGLTEAVRIFADKMSNTGVVEISVTENNFPEINNKTTEIIIYRVVLELINNTIKHANAKNIFIQFSTSNSLAYIQYEDNGKGFDVNSVLALSGKGLGLSNIIQRILSVNGNCKFESEKGKGMKVKIIVSVEEK